jgi:hypothetical protein
MSGGETHPFGWLITVSFLAGLLYALVVIARPDLATRWEVRSWSRASKRSSVTGRYGAAVGSFFQRRLGIDPEGESWGDPVVLRRVRRLGIALALLYSCFLAIGMWLIAS